MKYKLLSDFIAWVFPAKSDRIVLRELCRDVDSRLRAEKIHKKYSKIIKKLQADYKKRRLRVVFLISDSSKWQYDSLYHEFDKDKDFEPLILVEPIDVLLKKESSNLDYKTNLKSNFDFFKNQGFNVQYAFDVQKEKYIDLKKFNPDMVFYQQPYGIPKCHDTEKVATPKLTESQQKIMDILPSLNEQQCSAVLNMIEAFNTVATTKEQVEMARQIRKFEDK